MAEQSERQRINEVLEQYWNRIRGGRPYPKESEIEQESPELAPIWDSCFLVRIDYTNAERPYHYVYLGKSLVRAYGGDDISAREVCETLVYPSSRSLVHKFKEVADKALPVVEESEFTNASGEQVRYRSNLLPLAGQDGEEVAYILGGMKWKIY